MAKRQNGSSQVAAAFKQGMELYRNNEFHKAVRPLQLASQAADPRARAGALRMLGHSLHRVGRDEEALVSLRQSESLARNDPMVMVLQAIVLRHVGRTEEAIEACRKALKIDPLFPNAMTTMIEMLVRMRRDDEAYEMIAKADAHGMSDHYIDITFSILAMRTGRHEEAIARLRRHEGSTDVPKKYQSDLMYALAGALDKLERYPEAWEAYVKANDLRDETWKPDQHKLMSESIVANWTPDAIKRLQEVAFDDERPVLVVGMPRSGTTLTEMTLAKHPRVTAAGELRTLGEAAKTLVKKSIQANAVMLEDIDPRIVRETAAMYKSTLDSVSEGKDRVMDKMPLNSMLLGLFAAMFPNGSIIHTRRDARATCLSCFFRNFEFPNPWSSRVEWTRDFYKGYTMVVNHWGEVFAKLDTAPTVHEVEYETFVQNREEEARKLVAAARVEWDERCLDVASQSGDVRTLRADQVGKGVYTSSVHHYEKYAEFIGEWIDLEAPTIIPQGAPSDAPAAGS